MNKSESLQLKGVALLFMLWHHLFNQLSNFDSVSSLATIFSYPIEYLLARATNPVCFFLLLGGYGLYLVNRSVDTHRYSRIFKLVLHYEVILAVFLSVGYFIDSNLYPGTLKRLVSNILMWSSLYNGECWFLFPYICLSLSSPLVFRLIDRYGSFVTILSSMTLYVGISFAFSRYGGIYSQRLIYNLLLYFYLLFPFSIGAIFARNVCNQTQLYVALKSTANRVKPAVLFILLVVIIAVRILINSSILDPVYALITICLLLQLFRSYNYKHIGFLSIVGLHSMNIWLIHTWFCYYFFHDWIYSFRYPIVIFVVLLCCSILTSFIINFLCNFIGSVFKMRTL